MQILRGPIEVLATIQFDNNPGFKADEVADIDANWMLSPEFMAVELSAAQPIPKTTFRLCEVLAKMAREVDHLGK